MFGVVIGKCYASVAPFWLREGAYAYYEVYGRLEYLNGSTVFSTGGTYGWKCLGVTGQTAVLEVTFNFTVREPAHFEIKAQFEIDIDVETREAFSYGESLGVLPYWIPTDVNKSDVIDSYMSLGNRTLSGTVGGVRPDIETPYKTFSGDESWAVYNQNEADETFVNFHEKDSGIMVVCHDPDNVWREKMGIIDELGPSHDKYKYGFLNLKDANVEFMPEPTSLLTLLQPYILATTIVAAAIASIYYFKIRKKKLTRLAETTLN